MTYGLTLVLLLMAAGPLYPQGYASRSCRESIAAVTDRSLYVTGENVRFSALVTCVPDTGLVRAGKVLYTELITPGGERVAGGKFRVENGGSEGSMAVPEDILTGNYYLRFYTREMRNCGPATYPCISLKIVNPDRPEVLETGHKEHSASPIPKKAPGRSTPATVSFQTGDNHFTAGDTVRFSVNLKGRLSAGKRVVLSAVPAHDWLGGSSHFNGEEMKSADTFFIPETRGVTLSGRVAEKGTGRPIPDIRVNLSVLGDRDILSATTASDGRFWFALPGHTGRHDLFLSPVTSGDTVPELLIDNDFCSLPVSLPDNGFTLDTAEAATALQLAVNHRIAGQYRSCGAADKGNSADSLAPFYGRPSEVIDLKRYIELPQLEEYFRELAWMVRVRKIGGQKTFRFMTDNEAMHRHEPLVLVDFVAVNNMEKVLAMPPSSIDRIELINALYTKGPATYGGIVSFVSKKSDFAGIDLPHSGTFLNYGFYQVPDKTAEDSARPGLPDARNTACWIPSVSFGGDDRANIHFVAPETPGNYLILITELGPEGATGLVRATIAIRPPEK